MQNIIVQNITKWRGQTNLIKHHIDLQGQKNIRSGYRPVPKAQQNDADEEVDKLLREGVIEPSSSPYQIAVVLVKSPMGLGDSA